MNLYSEKILLAWSEAITGNVQVRDWLLKNGYPELGLFCFALHFDEKSSDWLFTNAPHLLATIKAVEGREDARLWLFKHYPLLHKLAMAADGDKEAMDFLLKNDRLIAGIATKIKYIKDEIEDANQDIHRWGFS